MTGSYPPSRLFFSLCQFTFSLERVEWGSSERCQRGGSSPRLSLNLPPSDIPKLSRGTRRAPIRHHAHLGRWVERYRQRHPHSRAGKFPYHLDIEIRNHRTPRTWTERLMSRPSLRRPEQMRMISSDPAACRGDRADQRLLLRPRMQDRIGDGTPMTSSSLRLFAAGKTAPPPEEMKEFLQRSCRLGQYPAQAVGRLVCGGIPSTAPTSWSIVASVCRGVGVAARLG